jgi:hypothetical protein
MGAPRGPQLGVGVQPGASGVVRARQVIIVGTGGELLVYSPAAGPNTLIASIAGADFTDSYQNAGFQGIASYNNNGAFFSATVLNGGSANWYEAPTEAGPWNLEAGIGFGFVSGTGGFLTIGSTAGQLQLGFNGGVIPQTGASGITTLAQLVAALEAAGILEP